MAISGKTRDKLKATFWLQFYLEFDHLRGLIPGSGGGGELSTCCPPLRQDARLYTGSNQPQGGLAPCYMGLHPLEPRD